MFADYQNGLVNLSASILKSFGVEPAHPTLPQMDALLARPFSNVVVMLLDGMGASTVRSLLPTDGFFNTHMEGVLSSVFPPTTTAATIALMAGRMPCETGWLGWKQYFPALDRIVVPFTNTDYYTKEPITACHAASTYIPWNSIFDTIDGAGVGRAYHVSPFGRTRTDTFDAWLHSIRSICAAEGRKFVYAYWEEPDSVMHQTGCRSAQTAAELRRLEAAVSALAETLEDTLLIVTADHGHRDTTYYSLEDYPELREMLVRPTSLEHRAVVFYVRDEDRARFPAAFRRAFGADFLLFTKAEVLEKQLFGPGAHHPLFETFIGDFLAVSVSDKGIVESRACRQFRSNHAGMTREEMEIPWIVVRR